MTDTDTNPETAGSLRRTSLGRRTHRRSASERRPGLAGAAQGSPDHRHVLDGREDRGAPSLVLTISRDGDAYAVAGTAGGSHSTPAWVANLEAHPDIDFEFGDQTYAGRVEVYREGAERERLWVQHVEQLPHFAAYPEQTGRVIPMARIVQTGCAAKALTGMFDSA